MGCGLIAHSLTVNLWVAPKLTRYPFLLGRVQLAMAGPSDNLDRVKDGVIHRVLLYTPVSVGSWLEVLRGCVVNGALPRKWGHWGWHDDFRWTGTFLDRR